MQFVKVFLLVAISIFLLVWGFIVLGYEALLFGLLISLSLFVGVFWFSDKIVLKMCNAERLTVYHSPTIFAAVEEMSKKFKVRMPRIFMIPGETPNAFSAGNGFRSSSIVFTEGILQSIRGDELRSVIAHELVHIKKGDALVGTLAATFAGFCGLGIGRYASATLNEDEEARFRRFGKLNISGIRFSIAPLGAWVIRSFMNVSREYTADERAAKLSGSPLLMANAIRTMEKKKYVHPLYTSPLAAHLFTVNPLTNPRAVRLFNTHPPMEKRIERLELMARRRVSTLK